MIRKGRVINCKKCAYFMGRKTMYCYMYMDKPGRCIKGEEKVKSRKIEREYEKKKEMRDRISKVEGEDSRFIGRIKIKRMGVVKNSFRGVIFIKILPYLGALLLLYVWVWRTRGYDPFLGLDKYVGNIFGTSYVVDGRRGGLEIGLQHREGVLPRFSPTPTEETWEGE